MQTQRNKSIFRLRYSAPHVFFQAQVAGVPFTWTRKGAVAPVALLFGQLRTNLFS